MKKSVVVLPGDDDSFEDEDTINVVALISRSAAQKLESVEATCSALNMSFSNSLVELINSEGLSFPDQPAFLHAMRSQEQFRMNFLLQMEAALHEAMTGELAPFSMMLEWEPPSTFAIKVHDSPLVETRTLN